MNSGRAGARGAEMRPALPLLALLLLLAAPRPGDAARDCYRPCLPSPDICLEDSRQCEDTNCNTNPRPVKAGEVPPGYTEDLRCVASMRREPLEIYKWGEIPPKPDQRTLTEKLDGITRGMDNRMCCNIDACSITDYKACMSQREADRLALLQGRRLEQDIAAEQSTLEKLRDELRNQG